MAKKSSKSNGKSLVIVESPAKAKTLSKFLGSDYDVRASVGHVADLPSKGLNIDVENGFKPTYELTERGKTVVKELKGVDLGSRATVSSRHCVALWRISPVTSRI